MAEGILIAVAHADQIRRQRRLARLLLRVAPAISGGLLVTAAIVRMAHVPLAVFWLVLFIAAAGLIVFAWFSRRVSAVTDATATELDADAALNGELRSAHWFASQLETGARPASESSSHDWTTFHLHRAADRLETVSWRSVYPPVKAARVWAGSTLLALSALALVLTSTWPSARGSAIAGRSRATGASTAEADGQLPADLQKQIDDLITAIQKGVLPMDAARAKVAELRDALSALDPKLQAALAKAAAEAQKAGSAGTSATDKQAEALAARAEKAAAAEDLPADMKWSLEDLAAKLAEAGKRKPGESGETSAASQDAKSGRAGSAGEAGAAQKLQDAGVQMTRTTAADAQSSQVMTTMAPMGGQPLGAQADASKGRNGAPLDLSALRKETVQADADSQGANVLAEMRRKSEQSHSKLAFSRVAPLAAYDKSHASPPPAPPDALKPLVKQYFIRK